MAEVYPLSVLSHGEKKIAGEYKYQRVLNDDMKVTFSESQGTITPRLIFPRKSKMVNFLARMKITGAEKDKFLESGTKISTTALTSVPEFSTDAYPQFDVLYFPKLYYGHVPSYINNYPQIRLVKTHNFKDNGIKMYALSKKQKLTRGKMSEHNTNVRVRDMKKRNEENVGVTSSDMPDLPSLTTTVVRETSPRRRPAKSLYTDTDVKKATINARTSIKAIRDSPDIE